MDALPLPTLMALLGGGVGLTLGFVARSTRFCTLSAIETAAYGGNFIQLRMWVFAIAIAASCVLAMRSFGWIDLSESVHMQSRIAILGPILGGLMFGLGMAAVGTCSFGAILRGAGGDLRGLVVAIFVGLTGYVTIRGLLAPVRMTLVEPASIPLASGTSSSIGDLTSLVTGDHSGALSLMVSVLAIAAMFVWCLKDRDYRIHQKALLGAFVVGLSIAAGWFVTGFIGSDDFDPQPVGSATFVAASSETIMYLMTFTGDTMDFNVGLFLGVFAGGFLAAWRKRELRLEGFDDTREMRRHLLGACLMGVGGVLAMGCSIGQGLTGVSTLALPSFLALFSIWGGALLGLHILFNGLGSLFPIRH